MPRDEDFVSMTFFSPSVLPSSLVATDGPVWMKLISVPCILHCILYVTSSSTHVFRIRYDNWTRYIAMFTY